MYFYISYMPGNYHRTVVTQLKTFFDKQNYPQLLDRAIQKKNRIKKTKRNNLYHATLILIRDQLFDKFFISLLFFPR